MSRTALYRSGLLSLVLLVTSASAAEDPTPTAAAAAPTPDAPSAAPLRPPAASASTAVTTSAEWHARYGERYKRNWGIDIVGVRVVSSGYMLRFDYRVMNAERAKPLFDKKTRPYLFDIKSGARLAVPAMENVGELRQTATPTLDRTYYVIFGNPGKLVQPGNRVSVVIGDFHADDLIVD